MRPVQSYSLRHLRCVDDWMDDYVCKELEEQVIGRIRSLADTDVYRGNISISGGRILFYVLVRHNSIFIVP